MSSVAMPLAEPRNGWLGLPVVHEVLESVPFPRLAPLIDEGTRDRIIQLSRAFAVPAQTVCYEARLSDSDRRTDLALCLLPGFLSNLGQVLEQLPVQPGADQAWGRSLAFLQDWASPHSDLMTRVPFVWAAFDLDQAAATLPVPCLGLCVDADFFARRFGARLPPPEPAQVLALADSMFQRLVGPSLPAALQARLSACLSNDQVVAKHFSFMLGRSPATFKLDVQLPVGEVANLLRRIGWAGSPERIQARIASLMTWSGPIQLNLVLHPELVGPLEVEFLTIPDQASTAARMAFLDGLVAQGLASPAKAQVLRAVSSAPVVGAQGAAIAAGWYVKVRLQGDTPVEAKTYLGLMPRPRLAGLQTKAA